jgi:hypothetical protein
VKRDSIPADSAKAPPEHPLQDKPLPDAAKRALVEAEERRRALGQSDSGRPAETGGRGGLDPVRYGDWETGGIATDF